MDNEKNTILIIENNAIVSDMISIALKRAGYYIFRAGDGKEGLHMIQSQDPDLILLDLPHSISPDSFELCEHLEEQKNEIPIIVFIFEDEIDLATALELNYIVKPVSIYELQDRIYIALLRSNLSAIPKLKNVGPFTFNTKQATVSKNGVLLPLGQNEYSLFKFLASQPGRYFSREELLQQVWGYTGYDVRHVDVYIGYR